MILITFQHKHTHVHPSQIYIIQIEFVCSKYTQKSFHKQMDLCYHLFGRASANKTTFICFEMYNVVRMLSIKVTASAIQRSSEIIRRTKCRYTTHSSISLANEDINLRISILKHSKFRNIDFKSVIPYVIEIRLIFGCKPWNAKRQLQIGFVFE